MSSGPFIRYLAVISEDSERLAGFYKRHFEMREIGRSEEGNISLSDGFYNFTILKKRPALYEPRPIVGPHHIGLQVPNLGDTVNRYLELFPRGTVVAEPADIHHGSVRIHDPDGNPVTLSEGDFGAGGPKRLPGFRHLALSANNPDVMRDFYSNLFGFSEVTASYEWRGYGKPNRFVADGVTNLAIHPFYSNEPGFQHRFGINHIGLLVNDIEGLLARLKDEVRVPPRPTNRPYEEYRMQDPDGTGVDLSCTKGYEVGFGVWERGSSSCAA